MRIDVHTHHYPAEFFRLIERSRSDFSFAADPTGRRIIRYKGSRFFGITPPMTDIGKRIEDMDRAGIDVAVLSLSTPNVYFAEPSQQPEVARLVNDSYAQEIAERPARLRGFASIPMDDPDAALRELHRAIDELKLSGVILLSNVNGRPLSDPRYRPFLEEAHRMRVCVLLHPMLPAAAEPFSEYVLGPIIGFPFDTTLAVARLCFSGLLRDLSGIRWIVAHLGGAVPYLMERMDNGWRDFAETKANIDELPSVYLKRLYYDTVSFSRPSLTYVRGLVGADHMLMGSDYPHLLGSIDRAVSSIAELDVPQADRDEIFSGTALRILNNAESLQAAAARQGSIAPR
ncbi:MAG: amidohydrolase [Chloroflexota bacterium]|nr:amidohydrolase [Chloroflexota bacterium]